MSYVVDLDSVRGTVTTANMQADMFAAFFDNFGATAVGSSLILAHNSAVSPLEIPSIPLPAVSGHAEESSSVQSRESARTRELLNLQIKLSL